MLRTVRAQLEAFPGYVVVLAGKCLRMIDYSFFFSNWTGLGHSMGGALASLAAISVKSNIPWAAVRLFTFGACFFFYCSGRRLTVLEKRAGQPRTGDAAFADLLESMIGRDNIFRGKAPISYCPTFLRLGFLTFVLNY